MLKIHNYCVYSKQIKNYIMNRHVYRLLITILLFLLCTDIQAQRKKVGLVLSGGGAKGAAEIGVLKVLEEANIPIDYIAGTSIGSIVGGLYAIGYRANDLDSMIRVMDWKYLLSDEVYRRDVSSYSKMEREKYTLHLPLTIRQKSPLAAGLVTGQNIYNLFSNLTIGYHHVDSFMNLPIPFYCVAVDILFGKEVVLTSGSLPLAMRSSMSVPALFSPVEWGNMLLVDGGELNNFPTDVVKKMGADYVIGVDLSSGLRRKDELNSMVNVISQLILIASEKKYQENKKLNDIYINPDLKDYPFTKFQNSAIDSMIVRGEQAARSKLPELLALKKKIYEGCSDSSITKNAQAIHRQDSIPINLIVMEGINKKSEEWVRKQIKIKEHSVVNTQEINRTISLLQGLDLFSNVEYRLSNEVPYDLILVMKEKEFKSLNIGIRFDSEEVGSFLLNVSNEKALTTNHHYAFTARLSQNPYALLEYNYGNFFRGRVGISYLLRYHDIKLYDKHHKVDVLNFYKHKISAFYLTALPNFKFQVGANFEYYHYEDPLYDTDYQPIKRDNEHFFNYYTQLTYDSFDNSYFPKKGGKIDLRGELCTDNLYQYRGNTPFSSAAFYTATTWRLTPHFYLLPSLRGRFLFGSHIPCIYQNYIGGIYDERYLSQQMSFESILFTHIVRNEYLAAKLALRYQISKFYLTATGEYSKESHHIRSILRGHSIYGISFRTSYDLFFGPISIQFNYSNRYKNAGVFVNAGLYF
jgi:NTE family protein